MKLNGTHQLLVYAMRYRLMEMGKIKTLARNILRG
jgi:hypothetical protein